MQAAAKLQDRTVARRVGSRLGWSFLAVALLTVVMLVPLSPAVQPSPVRDSGIFLYSGQQLLQGKVLYREVWDNKPPLIFYLEALGLSLGGESGWGVWALQLVFLLGAGLLAVTALARVFGLWAAGAASAAGWLTLAWVLHGGNYTEEYALLFQFAALFAFVRMSQGKHECWMVLLCGAAAGLAFSLKQSLVGIGAAVGLYLLAGLLIRRTRQNLMRLALFAGGFALAAGAVIVPVLIEGAFRDYIDAAFIFNQVYSNLGLLERVQAVSSELAYMLSVPGFAAALLAWVGLAVALALHAVPAWARLARSRWFSPLLIAAGALAVLAALIAEMLPGNRPGFGLLQWAALVVGVAAAAKGALVRMNWFRTRILPRLEQSRFRLPETILPLSVLAALALPIEIALVSLSGRDYLHYNITLVPVCTVLVALLVYAAGRVFQKRGQAAAIVVGTAVVLLTLAKPALDYPRQMRYNPDVPVLSAAELVRRETSPDQPVLVWSGDTVVNFLAGRSNPTRYVHARPLFEPGYATPERVQSFLSELKANPPALLLVPKQGGFPFPEMGQGEACGPVEGAPISMQPVIDYLCASFRLDPALSLPDWSVYRPKTGLQSGLSLIPSRLQ